MEKMFMQNYLKLHSEGKLMGKTPVETFNNYKIENACSMKFDCDASKDVRGILEGIFGHSSYTDTLISGQNILTEYIRNFHSEILIHSERRGKLEVPNIEQIKDRMVAQGVGEKKNISNAAIWNFYVKEKNLKINESVQAFFEVLHIIGNFSPVCKSFNSGRYRKVDDNFFIALDRFRLFFYARENGASNEVLYTILRSFLSGVNGQTEDEVINEVKKWLSSFKGYEAFITKYYLKYFLENDDANSKPKEVWAGLLEGSNYLEGFLENIKDANSKSKDDWTKILKYTNYLDRKNLLPLKEEFIESIEVITEVIKKRGMKMTEVLQGTR